MGVGRYHLTHYKLTSDLIIWHTLTATPEQSTELHCLWLLIRLKLRGNAIPQLPSLRQVSAHGVPL